MSQSTEVGPDAFINAAIEAGFCNGVEALDANERLIFLISEAEVHCDKDGIRSLPRSLPSELDARDCARFRCGWSR